MDDRLTESDIPGSSLNGRRTSELKMMSEQCVCFEETTSFGSVTSCSCYGFKKNRILLLINYNDGFIDDDEWPFLC